MQVRPVVSMGFQGSTRVIMRAVLMTQCKLWLHFMNATPKTRWIYSFASSNWLQKQRCLLVSHSGGCFSRIQICYLILLRQSAHPSLSAKGAGQAGQKSAHATAKPQNDINNDASLNHSSSLPRVGCCANREVAIARKQARCQGSAGWLCNTKQRNKMEQSHKTRVLAPWMAT